MAETHDTRGARRRALAAAKPKTIKVLPKELLVSIFVAIEDPIWVRHTMPRVCKEWNEIYCSKDASPLHETLDIMILGEVAATAPVGGGPRRGLRPVTRAAAQEWARSNPDVPASRVISWAERRAGSVRKLSLGITTYEDLKCFSPEDLGALISAVGPSLTELVVAFNSQELREKQLLKSLRDVVVPAGRLRSLRVSSIASALVESDVEPIGQLAGSLEELVLQATAADFDYEREYEDMDWGFVSGFPRSLCALTELRRLGLSGHRKITALPAEISSLKKLEKLELRLCSLSSLPKELGKLSGLTKLDLSYNPNLGTVPQDEAFPAGLGRMKSLRELGLEKCGLRTVPAFVGELESLEKLDLGDNDRLQIDSPLDFLIERCPRLRQVKLGKGGDGVPWTPESLAHLRAFQARLRAERPSVTVSRFESGH